MKMSRQDASTRAAERRDHEAQVAAVRLGRLLEPSRPLPPMPHQQGRVTDIVADLARRYDFEQRAVTIDSDARPLEQVIQSLTACQVRTRKVHMVERWWEINMPVLVVETSEGLANIIPGPLSAPVLHRIDEDPVLVTEDIAAGISRHAVEVIRPLHQTTVRLRDLLRISMVGMGRDLTYAVLASLGVGAISLAIPIATSVIFNEIVPSGNIARLYAVVLTLLALVGATGAFAYIRTFAFIRIMDATEMGTGGALIDRLLRLPIGKLRQWSGASIATRFLIWTRLQEATGRAINVGLISAILLILNAILMVVFIPVLGLVALLLGFMLLAVSWLIIRKEKSELFTELEESGPLYSVTLDLMRGWIPIRMSNGEVSAFGRWAQQYATYRAAFNRRWGTQILVDVLVVAALGAMTFSFILVAYFLPADSITSGSFLAFLAAFAQFSAGLIGTVITVRAFEAIGPALERIAPILQIEPEVGGAQEHPGVLSGGIEVRNLGFRYSDDLPWVLRNVSFSAEPGQFIAVVGTSGSGKSTLMRMLLGFDFPRRGLVMFDDSDLSGLDLAAVRKQFGVVLQSSLLLPGTIRDNIVVSSGPLPDTQIWQLLDRVEVGDSIRAMPSGLDTPVDENSTLVSGGQRQRILLARALANDPVILLLDEATSALDNLTQEAVTRNIAALGMTRIVIAHRLSTIRSADLILVLDQGEIVESGSYDQLINVGGLFSELVSRQEI